MIDLTCPHCGHESRWEETDVDSYECPECGAVFAGEEAGR